VSFVRVPHGVLPRSALRGLRSTLSDDRGSLLVEAMVAASLVVLLAVGFLKALDGAATTSTSNRARGAAASLAQEDMDRMRGLRTADLINLNQTRTVAQNSITFTILSKAKWVDDATGYSTGCVGNETPWGTSADYLKITSSVTWPSMGEIDPVKSESVVAMPPGGSGNGNGGLAVRFLDRAGNGISNITANLTGPQNDSDPSDTNGCVYWPSITGGTYTVSFSKSGWVDTTGTQAVSDDITVNSGDLNSMAFVYDRAAKLDTTFQTKIGAASATNVASTSFTIANGGMPSPGYKTFTGTSSTTLSSGYAIYPFTDAYAIWGGACAGADPRVYSDTTPTVVFAQGGASTATVRLPNLNILVKRGSTSGGATLWPTSSSTTYHLRITPATAGCGSVFSSTLNTNSTGTMANPGLPYGDYNVCVDDGTKKVSTSTAIQNRAAAGATQTTLILLTGTGSTSVTCA
jgi:hypothetical protein